MLLRGGKKLLICRSLSQSIFCRKLINIICRRERKLVIHSGMQRFRIFLESWP